MPTVVSVEKVPFNGWVYDVSSENGVFDVFPGVTLKNTDSVYVCWPGCNMHEAFDLSRRAAEKVTEHFTPPIQLEFEKVMCPLALYTKKRYTYQCWEQPEKPKEEIVNVGTQIVRRDTCEYVRDVLGKITELIIKHNNEQDALIATRRAIQDLFEQNVETQRLILTRNIKRSYKNENIPHVRLAKRLADRNDVDQVRAGDRIQFVFVDNGNIETPAYVSANKIQLDAMAYFDKQFKTPIDTIWGLIMKPELIYTDIIDMYKSREKKKKDVQGFLKLFHLDARK